LGRISILQQEVAPQYGEKILLKEYKIAGIRRGATKEIQIPRLLSSTFTEENRMKIKPLRLWIFILLFAIALVFGADAAVPAEETTEPSLDVVIKISQLEKTLEVIDDVSGIDPRQPTKSPTAQIRVMAHGTKWIDPERSIVIGMKFVNGQPETALLIPFQQPNVNFQTAYNGLSGPDYYILRLPPGEQANISNALKAALIAASRRKGKASLSVELAVARLLEMAGKQIQAGLNLLGHVSQTKGSEKVGLTSQEIQEMFSKIVDTAGQLKTLSFGFDINKKNLATFLEAQAVTGSKLAGIFSPQPGKTILLGGYRPGYQINFRSRNYDICPMIEVLNDCFGKLYKKMGINFSDLVTICHCFTGEMAGGMSYGPNGMSMEIISVLKDTETPADFLETVYLPWLMKFSRDMAGSMERQLGRKVKPLYARTADSTVAGYKVIGIKSKVPYPVGPVVARTTKTLRTVKYESRMTTVGNFLLIAPDDKRMAELIRIVKKLKKRPSKGPLMRMDIDIGAYLASISEMIPVLQRVPQSIPEIGKATCLLDMKDGRLSARSSVRTDDVKKVIALFKNLRLPVTAAREKRKLPESFPEPKKLAEPPRKDATYWLDKGALCSTYGNDKAAIRYFKKAIKLDPKNSEAYFYLGLSYGEIGEYKKGIASINKALDLCPGEGIYLYGRGRLYLLAGDKPGALKDFKRAAESGNQEARDYLKHSQQRLF